MSTHSVAEAKNKLSQLINRALNGEGIVITRHGQPVVELKPVQAPKRPVMTDADFEWLRRRREQMPVAKTDAVTLIRRMRDEDWR
jgi:prevent-host-death family protein